MPKQHVYEVYVRELHSGVVLVAANSEREARRAAKERYENAEVEIDYLETVDLEEWPVRDLGEDPGQ